MRMETVMIFWVLFSPVCHGADQAYLENELGKTLVARIDLFRALNKGTTPTNWAQLRTDTNEQHLAILENEFKKLRKDAGFATSIIEKYVFMPAVSAPYRPQSQVLMMSSTPVRLYGEIGRFVIFDEAKGSDEPIQRRWWQEEIIQQMIAKAGVKIPEPETAPPLKLLESTSSVPTPFRDKVYLLFRFTIEKLKGSGNPKAQSDGRSINPLPIALAVPFVLGGGFLLFRLIRKRRQARLLQ